MLAQIYFRNAFDGFQHSLTILGQLDPWGNRLIMVRLQVIAKRSEHHPFVLEDLTLRQHLTEGKGESEGEARVCA
jgi:hypothetical protein